MPDKNLHINLPTPLQRISFLSEQFSRCFIKRDDLIHPEVGGNKWRKLQYVVQLIQEGRVQKIITMGGMHSNHIAAVAAVGHLYTVDTQAYIRDTGDKYSPTLDLASRRSMEIVLIDRSTYRLMRSTTLRDAQIQDRVLYLPEGGTGEFALPGCKRLGLELNEQLEGISATILCAAGTLGTARGLEQGLSARHKLHIHPAGRKFNLREQMPATDRMITWTDEEDLRPYGRISTDICDYIEEWKQRYGILIDPIYMAPMLQLIESKPDIIGQSEALVIYHSGGTQGNAGYYKKIALMS